MLKKNAILMPFSLKPLTSDFLHIEPFIQKYKL